MARHKRLMQAQAEATWANDAEALPARAVVASCMLDLAARNGQNRGIQKRVSRVGPLLERSLLLAGLDGAAGRFATLARSGEDDVPALWMLGLSAADALTQRTEAATWHAIRDVLTSHAWDAFEEEVSRSIAADPRSLERLVSLAGEVIDAEVTDPAACVSSAEREGFLATVTHWREKGDFVSLSRGHPNTALYWGPSGELLLLVHRASRHAFVDLLSRYDLPYPVADALASRRIVNDLDEVCELLGLAQVAFDDRGAWNGSLVAPLLLGSGLEHLRTRIRCAADEVGEEWTDEALAADLTSAATRIARATLGRPDGRPLGFLNATGLVRDLAWRLSRASLLVPKASDVGTAPAWFLMTALTEQASPAAWPGWRSPDLAHDDAYFAAVAAALPAVGARDPAALAGQRLPLPGDMDDTASSEAVETAISLAPRPSDWIHGVLGWSIARSPEPARAWTDQWRSILRYRERDLHRFNLRLDVGSDAVPKALWAIGLGAVDWLSTEGNGDVHARRDLSAAIYDAALERWLTTAFNEDFWSSAVVHIVVRSARNLESDAEAHEGGSTVAPQGERASLAQLIVPFVGPNELFLRIIRSLQLNGISNSDIAVALETNGLTIDGLAASIEMLGGVDQRFASTNSHLMSQIQAHQARPGLG
ncbi:hypothetical protein P7D22_14785 [Lichenihabitans sp. Uapishka_5]|uniref:hypothetical protein n=1 Tax=Lichenihabitans sp. Uapishka_5 TaxID=3037302 RepID=UPI0029E81882|nr:hypothetical protein [Lichenihabitans sp. Uapishka_5]MDX7952434.1 hypothetical protein [Lichenihabitans sp. Uapishka_5]